MDKKSRNVSNLATGDFWRFLLLVFLKAGIHTVILAIFELKAIPKKYKVTNVLMYIKVKESLSEDS